MAVTQKTAVNFSIDQGADFSKNFTVTTDGSTAYDISDLTLQAQMRKSYDSSSAAATLQLRCNRLKWYLQTSIIKLNNC